MNRPSGTQRAGHLGQLSVSPAMHISSLVCISAHSPARLLFIMRFSVLTRIVICIATAWTLPLGPWLAQTAANSQGSAIEGHVVPTLSRSSDPQCVLRCMAQVGVQVFGNHHSQWHVADLCQLAKDKSFRSLGLQGRRFHCETNVCRTQRTNAWSLQRLTKPALYALPTVVAPKIFEAVGAGMGAAVEGVAGLRLLLSGS